MKPPGEFIDLLDFEMETAAILEFARRMGHQASSANAIIANRVDQRFSKDPYRTVDNLIQKVLERLIAEV
jgi:uridine phosphorylase